MCRGTLSGTHHHRFLFAPPPPIRMVVLPGFRGAYPPVELVAHIQVPRHYPLPLHFGDQRVNLIQQKLRHAWFSRALDTVIQQPLEKVGVVGLQCLRGFGIGNRNIELYDYEIGCDHASPSGDRKRTFITRI